MKSSLKAKSIALLLAVATIFSSVFSADYIVADAEGDIQYTVENPFVFPTEDNVTATLEADGAYKLEHDDPNEEWELEVAQSDWAGNGKFLNCLDDVGDAAYYAFNAPCVGVYTVTIIYRSGNLSNGIKWSTQEGTTGKIKEGSVTAGANDNAGATHEVTFEMIVEAAGAGVLVIEPGDSKGPQIDKFEIVLAASKSELQEVIAKAGEFSPENYTEHSYEILTTELTSAGAVYEDTGATADEINIAIYALENAIAGLVSNSIEIYVGESITFRNNAGNHELDWTSEALAELGFDTDIANVAMTGVDKYESREITAIDSLVDGGTYWIKNKRADRLLTKDLYENTEDNGLVLDGQMTAGWVEGTDLLNHLWTVEFVTDADGTRYLVKDKESGYLNMLDNAQAGFVDAAPGTFTILNNSAYDSDAPWRFKQGSNLYLNHHGGGSSSRAAAWNGSTAENDSGSTWYMYECVDRSYTDITFTGASAGETTVELGGETYNITVKDVSVDYVVDFGLPVTFDLSGESYKLATDANVSTTAKVATVAIESNNQVTYTLEKPLQGVDTVTIPTNIDGVTATINVYPATSVYYEQDFMSRADDTKWDLTHATTELTQQAAQPGADVAYNYGYDSSYDTAGNTYVSATASGAKGTFTFTGTGVDIYGNCNAATGLMMVLVREGNSQGKLVEMMTVDTNLNYVDANGNSMWPESVGTIGEIAGVPIVTVDGLAHGTYEVSIIYVAQTDSNATGIVIDGFRVHGTLDDPEDQNMAAYQALYAKDDESYPAYYEMRDAVITGLNVNMSESGSIYAEELSEQIYDSVGSMTGVTLVTGTTGTTNVVANENLKDFLDNSSKNELYLYPGQSLVFKLGAGTVNPQIAMRALTETAEYQILVDGVAADEGNLTLSANTEMYYSLTMTENEEGTSFTIANTGSGALAITKLKVPGATGTFVALAAEDLAPALLSMGYKEKPDAGADMIPVVNPFADITVDDYFYEAVLWALGEKITDGWTATEFAPEMECTRGQVVTFLWRAAGMPEATITENPFADVAENTYYYDAILWAVEKGITDGWTEDSFAPEMECTRGQILTFIWRAAGEPEVPELSNPFADIAENAYYYDAILWAVENGITDGWTEDSFAPEMECTRGQIVTFLYRAK